jgi:muramoyltetrapeptide carboxypeptidase
VRSRVDVPIVTGLPFGHIPVKVTLAVGSMATLKSDGPAVTLTMRDYRALK